VSGKRRARTVVLAVLLLAVATACGTGATPGTGGAAAREVSGVAGTPAGAIVELGSGLLMPLMKIWAATYHQKTPGVTVSVNGGGSGLGIASATDGRADIGASDAYLSSGDLVKAPSLLNIPLAVSAQLVIYNVPGLSQGSHVRLNGRVLAAMYEGTITRWNDQAIADLNPRLNLPDIQVVPVHRSDSSGDTFLFTSYLSTQDPAWNDDHGYGTTLAWPPVAAAVAASGSSAMLADCARIPGCVGYNGISYLTQTRADRLGYAALANSVGQYTLPTPAAIRAAVAPFVALTPPNETISLIDGPAVAGYPILNYEYAIVSTRQPDRAKASAVKAFLDWVITSGNSPTYVSQVNFQPLPPAVAILASQQIARIG
jgi:phosphate transport system substrate-binding protein